MLNIIPLQKEHIDSICEIENESFGDPWKKRFFLDLFDNPLAVCFTALYGTEVAGYLIAYHIYGEIQILNIAVKKNMRKKKVATELFGVIFDYAKSEDAEKFTLEVRPSNTSAVSLYKKLGFRVDGIRRNYYKKPQEDAVLMSLNLR